MIEAEAVYVRGDLSEVRYARIAPGEVGSAEEAEGWRLVAYRVKTAEGAVLWLSKEGKLLAGKPSAVIAAEKAMRRRALRSWIELERESGRSS